MTADTLNASLRKIYLDNYSTLLNDVTRLCATDGWCTGNAEDIVQDVYFKLCTSTITCTHKEQLKYLRSIVHNMSVDYYRKHITYNKHFGNDNTSPTDPISTDTPENNYINAEMLEQINTALKELPERTRYVFEQHRIYGVKQNVIAKELGVSSTLINFMIRDALAHCNQKVRFYKKP